MQQISGPHTQKGHSHSNLNSVVTFPTPLYMILWRIIHTPSFATNFVDRNTTTWNQNQAQSLSSDHACLTPCPYCFVAQSSWATHGELAISPFGISLNLTPFPCYWKPSTNLLFNPSPEFHPSNAEELTLQIYLTPNNPSSNTIPGQQFILTLDPLSLLLQPSHTHLQLSVPKYFSPTPEDWIQYEDWDPTYCWYSQRVLRVTLELPAITTISFLFFSPSSGCTTVLPIPPNNNTSLAHAHKCEFNSTWGNGVACFSATWQVKNSGFFRSLLVPSPMMDAASRSRFLISLMPDIFPSCTKPNLVAELTSQVLKEEAQPSGTNHQLHQTDLSSGIHWSSISQNSLGCCYRMTIKLLYSVLICDQNTMDILWVNVNVVNENKCPSGCGPLTSP